MSAVISYSPAQIPITQTNGVLSSLDCIVSHSSGMDISISTGQAFIRGTFTHTEDPQILTVANNASGTTRYDLVVIHVDLVAATADYRILTGNLNPTQNSSVWELPLAMATVPNGAVSVDTIQNLRVISNDGTPKTITTLTKAADTVVAPGQEVTLAWDTPSAPNDIYRFALLNTYIGPRISAFFNVHSAIRWVPDVATSKPVVFTVYNVDLPSYRTTEIYRVSSPQLAPGNVDFTFDQALQIQQGDVVYMTVKNTTDTNITIKSVADTFPLFQVQFTTYPIQMF